MNQPNAVSRIIDDKLANFINSGIATVVATSNQANEPHLTRAWAGQISADRSLLTLYLPTRQALDCLDDLSRRNQIAVVFSRPIDYVSIQLKGECVEIGANTFETPAAVETFWQAFMQALMAVGLTGKQAQSLWSEGITPLTINVKQCFGQTPGPGAGEQLSPPDNIHKEAE